MKKIIITLSILVGGFISALAQGTSGNCVGFVASTADTSGDLTESQLASLKLKVEQIITRNKVSTTTLYNAFIITPQVDIISQESVNSGIRPVNTVVAEVTLIASNSIDQSVYGSTTVEVKATANSEDRAMSSVITSLRPTDPRFAKFIKTAVSQITSYYSNNMPTILRKTETLISAEKYDDAIIFLESIPTCVPSYEQSSDAIQALHKMVSDKDCYVGVTMAERHISLGEYSEARDVLMDIKAGSDCDSKVSQLLAEVSSQLGKDSTSQTTPPVNKPTSHTVPATKLTPAVATASGSGVLTCDFENFDVDFVSCVGNPADNTVELTIMVRNVSELANDFRLYSYHNSTFLYNESGDTFYCKSISNGSFTLQPNMPRKVTITFDRIPTSNKVLSGLIGANDTSESSIKITNMAIKW